MMRFIFCASTLLVFLGCGDLIPVIPPLTISGHLFKYCGGEPVTTGTLTILSPFGSTLATDIPDASGFFNLEYKGTASRIVYDDNIGFSGEEIYVAGLSGSITAGDLGNLYLDNEGTVKVRLKVLNAMTTADTLFFGTNSLNVVKIAGPFVDGVVHTFENIVMPSAMAPCDEFESPCESCAFEGVGWDFNRGSSLAPYPNLVKVGLCGCGQVNEVEIVIE